jgi:hypothetical protein
MIYYSWWQKKKTGTKIDRFLQIFDSVKHTYERLEL